jgi:hypothetical protein
MGEELGKRRLSAAVTSNTTMGANQEAETQTLAIRYPQLAISGDKCTLRVHLKRRRGTLRGGSTARSELLLSQNLLSERRVRNIKTEVVIRTERMRGRDSRCTGRAGVRGSLSRRRNITHHRNWWRQSYRRGQSADIHWGDKGWRL